MNYAIAVLDIGKTNKKILIYDDQLNQIDSVFKSIPAIPYEELEVEDVKGIEEWFYENLRILSGKHNIGALSITTHGATCVCTNGQGDISIPVVAYTNEVEEEFHREFYNLAGEVGRLQRETGTAQVKPLINLAKLIYFMKKRFPEEFVRTENILMYPQYFGYRLTGVLSAEYTYTGCHTYLWDFGKWNWSSVADSLGFDQKLPGSLKNPGDKLGSLSKEASMKTGLKAGIPVTVGVHDSNSSLIPYLVKGKKDFILNSTGTWCVVMHPTDFYHISDDDIGKTVFYNISARQDLVKTAIFMGGLEFESYMNLLFKIHGRTDFPDFDRELIQMVLKESEEFIIPGIVKGAGQFPDSLSKVIEKKREYTLEELRVGDIPDFFKHYEYAYAVLNLSLAIQTKVAIERLKAPMGSPLYVEGGFRKNIMYLSLLASLFPESPLYTTSISEATSLGAAMLGKILVDNVELDTLADLVNIEMTCIEPEKLNNFNEYINGFLKKV